MIEAPYKAFAETRKAIQTHKARDFFAQYSVYSLIIRGEPVYQASARPQRPHQSLKVTS